MVINTRNTRNNINSVFNYNIKDLDVLHCVYYHSAIYENEKRMMYVGTCLLKSVLLAPDARRNRAWREYVGGLGNVELTIVATFMYSHEAFNEMAKIVRENRPYCNIQGEVSGSICHVRCITDGHEYQNAADACRFYDFAASTMSNHLNNRIGYKTIRGMIFERFW